MMFKKFHFILISVLLTTVVFTSCNKDDDEPAAPASPAVNSPLHIYGEYFYVNWVGVTGAEGYVADVATDQDFNNILPDYIERFNNEFPFFDNKFFDEVYIKQPKCDHREEWLFEHTSPGKYC